MAVGLPLDLLLIVLIVHRWSNNQFIIFTTFYVLCTRVISNRAVHLFRYKNTNANFW
jgi:hypothetical protein